MTQTIQKFRVCVSEYPHSLHGSGFIIMCIHCFIAALRGIIDALGEIASNWLTIYEQLNMFTGYGYDENHDSLPDTHIR